jgi:hypothetical protein
MTVSRVCTIAAIALSGIAAVGCSAPRTQTAEAPAPIVVQSAPPPAPVVTAEVVPAPLPASTVAISNEPPVVVASNAPSSSDSGMITERAPRADRN